jgi:hypothetical protein
MKSNSDIDNFFKQKLADPVVEAGYREEDWAALEKMMDKGKRRRIIYWLPVLSGVAALVLIVLGWWLFKPEADNDQNTKQQITKAPKHNQYPKVDSINKTTDTGTAPALVVVPQPKNKTEQHATEDRYVNKSPQITYIERKGNIPVTRSDQQNVPQPNQMEQPVANTPTGVIATNVAGVDTTKAVLANNIEKSPEPINTDAPEKGMAATAKTKKAISISSIFGRPQFALTIVGAPDINAVNSFNKSKTGTNLGLLISASFNKLTVSTGVAYSYKPYSIAFADYTSNYYFRSNPTDVLADCRMLDIPINVDYQLFNKNRNKISVGTGLSSYIMLRENYTYQYADPNARGPRSYAIASPGKYFFGVVNLQATYKRQINSKVDLSLQPYVKLPLGGVGASKVRLQSAGVAVGVSWNINSLIKKK